MARRSQCSSAGDNPLDPNYLPPHYREEYRLAVDVLVEEDLDEYYHFLLKADVVDFLSSAEIEYIQRSVRVPQHIEHPEQRFLEAGDDGSSDTYWPLHSDLDAPGLDLGWPQIHHFIGPTEVTTLVNPPEPDMPSIKEQARRLIKNAQQVVAIVMDMFTDVDIFADILNAAMRNVAVYVLLDKENCHHFLNMVSNCRVHLQSIQCLRVRTVCGITYQCRSGKSFRGQMMDRFLLTDCRAVLSGNYSFMWSFEKLHRCMAHLFLGQLVSTFDEEFRILFAQSQPLIMENVLPPMEDFSLLQKRQYPSERHLPYREPRKFLSLDTAHPDDWARHSHDDRTDPDQRMMPLKIQEVLCGPAEVYSRYLSQQSRLDPTFDQCPSKMQMMENPAFKRHSYAEGGHGRYSYPFLQGAPEHENQGRQLHRGQQPFAGAEREADCSGYDRFWNQDFHTADQYSEPGLPPEMDPHDDFDPVLNYLSSTRNADFNQSSENLPAADLLSSPSQHRRLSLGQPYACQTSPTPSNTTDQKKHFLETNTDRKDPTVKRGLRNWRINSYLSAYDNPGDDGLPSTPPNAPNPFEDPSETIQQTASGIDVSVPKIPNVREFKIPAIPRASQMPSYAKTTAREPPKKTPDEPPAATAEAKPTPTPSESSSTTEGEKAEEAEPKEPKTVQREDSFRRKHNAAVQRSSRLRSSLIFNSLEQQHTAQDTKTAPGQQDEESKAEQKKLPYVSQVFGHKRSTAREPFEWSRYIKSSTLNNAVIDSKLDDGNIKAEDKDSAKDKHSKDLSENSEVKPPVEEKVNSSAPMLQSKSPDAEPPKAGQTHKPSLTGPVFVDMSDPDNRLMFFKELAAKRKAAKAAEAEKNKDKILMKTPTEPTITTVKKEEAVPNTPSEKMADTSASEGLSEENAARVSQHLDPSDKTNKEDVQSKNDPKTPQSSNDEQSRISTDSEKRESKNSQSEAALHVSAETETPRVEAPKEQQLSNPAVNKRSLSRPPTLTNAFHANVPSIAQGTGEPGRPRLDSTSQDPGPVEIPSSSPAVLPEWLNESEQNSVHILSHPGPQISPSHSGSAPFSTSAENKSSDVKSIEDSISTRTSSILPQNANESCSPSEPSKSVKEMSSFSQTQSELTKAHQHSVSTLTLSKTCSAVFSRVESEISPGSLPDPSSLQTSTKINCGEKHVPESENKPVVKAVIEGNEVVHSSKNIEADSTPLSISSPLSCLPEASDLESKSRSDQNEPITLPGSPADPPTEHPDFTSGSSTSNASKQVTPPPEPHLSPATSCPAETGSAYSPLSETLLSPETEQTHRCSDSICPPSPKDSDQTLILPSKETSGFTEPDLLHTTPQSMTEDPPESTVPAEDIQKESGEKDTDAETTSITNKSTVQICSEKTNDQSSELPEIPSDEVAPQSPPSKLQKSNQSRYHSSTANVLSSSNLRDDTKLLLEQISANSQSRNEATKESAVTDDEKEDENDKNAKRDKDRGVRTRREPPKSDQERDKLLERIQSMRKERKVYSRFEMAP
uniref:protein FAM83H n=1 Tax=Semicossyphus pulcher TaxID=241346 RepID=UPI0037E75CA8